jgi:D-alanyl-D-alanine endopeptidase (penicillin-binding protein 7)
MGQMPAIVVRLLLVGSLAVGSLEAAEDLRVVMVDGAEGRETARAVAPARLWDGLDSAELKLRSGHVLVVDRFGNEVYAKGADQPVPIASITKLMTAMVVLDSGLPMDEPVSVTREDRDLLKLTGSRLGFGASLARGEMVRIALMASENRAASALARTYPGGKEAFVRAMNAKAKELGMHRSRFTDPTGLDAGNRASARDLVRMVRAAYRYPLIREATTTERALVHPYPDRGPLRYGNTNRLLRNEHWRIELSKTGYINEAGRCLVMHAAVADQPLVIVLLDSFGKLTPFGDSNRLRHWIEAGLTGERS